MPIGFTPLPLATPPAGVGVAGMAWHTPWTEPNQLHKREAAAFLQDYEARGTPPPIVPFDGIPYVWPLDQPFFPPRVKHWLHMEQMESLTPATLPVGIVGSAWYQRWSEPFFSRAVRTSLQSTEMWGNVGTPPGGISGMAWFRDWERPVQPWQKRQRLEAVYHPGPALSLTPATLPVGIAGIAWRIPWSEPQFLRAVKPERQQTQMWDPPFVLSPVGISGIAWFRPWELPVQPWWRKRQRLEIVYHPLTTLSLTPATLPVGIRGMAWRRDWDMPKPKPAVAVSLANQPPFVSSGLVTRRAHMQVYILD